VRAHGFMGLGIVVVAEVLLFLHQPLVGRWFTPLVWTGYVLFVDALLAQWTGHSYLTTARLEGVLVALVSIVGWWLFEWYNAPRFWQGGEHAIGLWWQYHRLEPNLFLRRVGYDWAFATIFPALFLTTAVLRASVLSRVRVAPWRPSPRLLRASAVVGAVFVLLPLVVVSAWLVPLVWTGFILLLEPQNARTGRPSWLADLARGDASRLVSLLVAGALCGGLWEFWNHWAITKWTYTVPYLSDVKIFEMPVLGYLGFPPFALECHAIYHWVRGVLVPTPVTTAMRHDAVI
jgi:hypothetical protein